jgi:hypothetical protein
VSIKNGASVAALFNARSQLVEKSGIPSVASGRGLLQAVYNRTGGGTGIVNQVTPPTAPLVATGASVVDALKLTADWNNVGETPAGAGVHIAPELNLQPGNDIWAYNNGTNNLNVYPPDADTEIDAGGAGQPYVLAPGKSRCFQCLTPTKFSSYGN